MKETPRAESPEVSDSKRIVHTTVTASELKKKTDAVTSLHDDDSLLAFLFFPSVSVAAIIGSMNNRQKHGIRDMRISRKRNVRKPNRDGKNTCLKSSFSPGYN